MYNNFQAYDICYFGGELKRLLDFIVPTKNRSIQRVIH